MSTIPTIHGTVSYIPGDNAIYVYGTGYENMTTINTAVNDVSVLNETSSKNWELTKQLNVNVTTATLYINDTDCDKLTFNFSIDHNITCDGYLHIDDTEITSIGTHNGLIKCLGSYWLLTINNSKIGNIDRLVVLYYYDQQQTEPVILDGNEFYNMKDGITIGGANNCIIKNNVIKDINPSVGVSAVAATFSHNANNVTISNNSIYNVTSTTHAVALWPKVFNSIIENNKIYNITGVWTVSGIHPKEAYNVTIQNNVVHDITKYGIMISYYSYEGSNMINTIINNTVYDCEIGMSGTSPYIDVLARDNEVYNCSTGYTQNSSSKRYLINNNFHDNIINLKGYGPRYYIDVNVIDKNTSAPISGATVYFTNEVDNSSYPAININTDVKSSTITGLNGHVPLPHGNLSTSIALIDYHGTGTTQINDEWTIGATASGYNDNLSAITNLNLTSDYYRSIPNTYEDTITIQLTGNPFNPIDNHIYYNSSSKMRYTIFTNGSIQAQNTIHQTDTDITSYFRGVAQ